MVSSTPTQRNTLRTLLPQSLLPHAHVVPASSRKGTRTGSGGFWSKPTGITIQATFGRSNIKMPQLVRKRKRIRSTLFSLNISTSGVSDLPVASLVPSSERRYFQHRKIGFKGHFPLMLSQISGKAGQKKNDSCSAKPAQSPLGTSVKGEAGRTSES